MKTCTIWTNAAHLAERITAEMAREFGCSRPRPRPRMMGLAQDKKPRREFDPFLPTASGKLRHPVMLAVRDDLAA